jgi:hypothetical protein
MQASDRLLEWASSRTDGSWDQLKSAVTWLWNELEPTRSSSPSMLVRNLSILGHVEISWAKNQWSVCAPRLVRLPGILHYGVLAGFRTRRFIDHVLDLADREDDYSVVVDSVNQQDAPTAYFVGATTSGDLYAFARAINVPIVEGLTDAILTRLPTLSDQLKNAPLAPPPPGEAEQFDAKALRWVPVSGSRPAHLERVNHFGRYITLFPATSSEWREVDLDLGVFAELQARQIQVVEWQQDAVAGTLRVRRETHLPLLQARALALASGLLPAPTGAWHAYANIGLAESEAVCRSLGQAMMATPGARASKSGGAPVGTQTRG